MFLPERIICLTEETVETLYLLGEERRSFTSADVPKVLDLKPDLVLTF